MDKEILKQIIIDQANEPMPSSIVPRGQYQELTELARNKQVTILSGIRRCGKSTLMQRFRQENADSDYFINLDDDRLIPFQLEDFSLLIEIFIELYGVQNNFYFDEIQNIFQWERFIRRLHNEGRKIYITGSNARLLSNELGTHLTGRYIPIKLYPYSFKEFVAWKDPSILVKTRHNSTQIALIKKYFSAFMALGGLPEYLENQQRQYLHTLFESILYKDIIARHKLPQEKPIKEILYYLASNNTKEFTYNSLRKLVGLASSNTVSEYCNYFESCYLCFILSRFSYSLKRQTNSPKKIYFIDQALAENIGFRISRDRGRTLENIVFLQLLRQGNEIYYHKEKQECDFVIRDGYEISQAIQVCMSLTDEKTKKRELGGLLEAMETYQLKTGLIITEDESNTQVIEHNNQSYTVTTVPCWQWLLD